MEKINWTIFGHKKQKQYLANALFSDNLAHGLLFVGPEHIGKTSLALEFARAINCKKNNFLCGECERCRQKDLSEISLIDQTGEIKITQIRELKKILSLKSFSGFKKIAIIANAENLNREAANALLRLLEEPAENTYIILTANLIGNLPETIISRLQKINFTKSPAEEAEKFLIMRKFSKSRQAEIVKACAGKIGLAKNLSENIEIFEQWVTEKALLQEIIVSENHVRIQMISDLAKKETSELIRLLKFWQFTTHENFEKKQVGLQKNSRILFGLEKAIFELQSNLNKKLVLDNLVLNF